MSAIGPKQTSLVAPHISAFGGKADMRFCTAYPLLTQSGHWRVFLCRKLPSSSLKAVNFEQTRIPDRLITILGASPQFRAPKNSGRRRWCSPTRRRSRSRAATSQLVFRRDAMTIYISRGRFTSDAVKGMVAKPENREEAVAKLFKSVGGKLIGWYLTFGHHDWMAIGEFPNEKAAASAVLAAAAGGSLSDIETTVAMSAQDAHATFESAGKAAKS